MIKAFADAGSFRDPSGKVYEAGGEIYRAVSRLAADDFAQVRKSGLLDRLMAEGKVVETEEVGQGALAEAGIATDMVLRHRRIPFISYPYEWPFPLLKSAALLHLDIHIEALKHGITLSDASAYNVQFRGVRPVFIDVLSFRPYRDGEIWAGHRQFCEQFLNPLLLCSHLGVAYNDWYRGGLEGIRTEDVARLLSWRQCLSPTVLTHVKLQARLQRAAANGGRHLEKAKQARLSKGAHIAMLEQLRSFIGRLKPARQGASTWQHYAENTTYDAEEREAKQRFISAFCEAAKPRIVFDLGCNSGEYSEAALAAGAKHAVGFDYDQGALEGAVARAADKGLDFLPLYQDSANPSPSQGWMCRERRSIEARGGAEAIIALAFEHHLAIGRNVPLEQLVMWLVGLAPKGIIEFVQKSDPTVQQLLALREDIFADYGMEAFEAQLRRRARVVAAQQVSRSGRMLYCYERT